MARVFKTHDFQRWMRKTDLLDAVLCSAVAEMIAGLIDAVLGGGVVKKRVALPGRGKRGGARTLLATNQDTRWFFILGFAKNERDNVSEAELEVLQAVAADLLVRTDAQLDQAIDGGALLEICK